MRAAVLVGAGVTGAVPTMAEKASAVEAVPPVQEEPGVAAESQLGSAAKPGKRQKSLFDF